MTSTIGSRALLLLVLAIMVVVVVDDDDDDDDEPAEVAADVSAAAAMETCRSAFIWPKRVPGTLPRTAQPQAQPPCVTSRPGRMAAPQTERGGAALQ